MTLIEKLILAGLPVISADEGGAITIGEMTPAQEQEYQNILLEHFQPAAYQELMDFLAVKQSYKDEYQTAITTLTQIRDADPASMTNAQVVAAVQYIAKVLLFVIRLIVRLL